MDDNAIIIAKVNLDELINEINKTILKLKAYDIDYNNDEVYVALINKLNIIVEFLATFEVYVYIYQNDDLYDYVLKYDFSRNEVDSVNNYNYVSNTNMHFIPRKSNDKLYQ